MNDSVQTDSRNPFAVAAAGHHAGQVAHTSASGDSDQQRAIAEVQAAMMIARMNPRDQVAAMDRILNACSRKTLAEVAVYSYGRGKQEVTGPSIRLAEAIGQQWGNLQFGIRELEQRNGESTVQAFAWDVETNTRREMTFQVRHERHTKKGITRLKDPRDIYELTANQGARRLRACLLAVIPGDVVEAALAQCDATLRSKVDITPERIQKMVAAFEAYGVSKEQIEERIQRRIDTIQPAQFISLTKIHNSLRDGMSKPGDWFDVAEETGGAGAAINDKLREKAANKKQKPEPEPEQHPDPEAITAEQVAAMIDKAQSPATLEIARDMIRQVADEQARATLTEVANEREQSFNKPKG